MEAGQGFWRNKYLTRVFSYANSYICLLSIQIPFNENCISIYHFLLFTEKCSYNTPKQRRIRPFSMACYALLDTPNNPCKPFCFILWGNVKI